MTVEQRIQEIEQEQNQSGNTRARIGAALRAIAELFTNMAEYVERSAPEANDYVVGYNSTTGAKIKIPIAKLSSAMSYYARLVKSEIIAGEFNDANTVFIVKDVFKKDSTVIYLNGARQTLGIDYVEDLNNNSIVLAMPPSPNGRIYVEIEPK